MTTNTNTASVDIATILSGAFHQKPAPVVVDPNTPTEKRKLCNELVSLFPDLISIGDEKLACVRAIYAEKHQRILPINPDVHAGIADPAIYETYHNVYKSENGFRPRSYITCKEMRADMERMSREAQGDQP